MNVATRHDPGPSKKNNWQQDDNTSVYVLTFEVYRESEYHSSETLIVVPNITKFAKNIRSFFFICS